MAIEYLDVASDSMELLEVDQGGPRARRHPVVLVAGTLLVAALAASGAWRAQHGRKAPGEPALRGPAVVPALGPEDGLVSYAAAKNLTGELRKKGYMNCSQYAYLKIMNVTHDNLGGKGPDGGEHSLIYAVQVTGGPSDGTEFEIHWKVTSPEADFRPQSPKEIGLQGKYGSINLKSGSNVSVSIEAHKKGENGTVPFEDFFFTFFDLDEGKDHEASESITIHHFSEAVVSAHSQIKAEMLDDGGLKLSATKEGSGDDNPKDPLHLTKTQFRKSATVSVKGSNRLDVTFAVGPSKEDNPRWFNFRGQPTMLCAARNDGTHPDLVKYKKKKGGCSGNRLGGLVVLLTTAISGASLHRPMA